MEFTTIRSSFLCTLPAGAQEGVWLRAACPPLLGCRPGALPGPQPQLCSWSSGRIPVLLDNGEGAVTPRSQALQLIISPGTSEGSYSPACGPPTPPLTLTLLLFELHLQQSHGGGWGRQGHRPSGWCAGHALCSRLRGRGGRGTSEVLSWREHGTHSEPPQEPQGSPGFHPGGRAGSLPQPPRSTLSSPVPGHHGAVVEERAFEFYGNRTSENQLVCFFKQ